MKRMSKSMKREFAQVLPTSKRLKIIQKRALERMTDVCRINNECYELMETERQTAGRCNTTNVVMISGNISYIAKYIESLRNMHKELVESCEEIEGVVNGELERYTCPISLRGRFKRMLYVSELLGNTISEMCNMHKELNEDLMALIKDKWLVLL